MFNVSHEFTAASISHSMWPLFLFLPETPLISFYLASKEPDFLMIFFFVVVVLQECSSGLLKFFKDFFLNIGCFSVQY